MMALVGASFGGGRQILGNPNFWYAQSVMPQSLRERWRLNLQDAPDDFSFTALLAVSGLLASALGLWLQTLSATQRSTNKATAERKGTEGAIRFIR